jgi:hypothetical protein
MSDAERWAEYEKFKKIDDCETPREMAKRRAFSGCARQWDQALLLASPRAQRRFNFAGGSLLSAAGVWALMVKRAA